MIHVADINKVTGYVRGGCSPVGMKKQYVTVFDESVLAQEKVYVSGGRIGTQVCCAPADLIKAARATTAKNYFLRSYILKKSYPTNKSYLKKKMNVETAQNF